MTRSFLATGAVIGLLTGPAAFAADLVAPPQTQLAQAHVADVAPRVPHYEWLYSYDHHGDFQGHWYSVR